MVACQLVVASSNPVEAIEIRGPIALSIFIFFVALFPLRLPLG
jgi:hypothetical protein